MKATHSTGTITKVISLAHLFTITKPYKMDKARLMAEESLLSRKFPSNVFRFINKENPESTYLRIGAKTNSGNVYTLDFDLKDFPGRQPKVFVTKMLKSKSGCDLNSASASMHTLPSEHGWTRICHYGYNSWTPNVSLYKVYVKCRLWLEMYESHLRTGHSMDYYLNEQA